MIAFYLILIAIAFVVAAPVVIIILVTDNYNAKRKITALTEELKSQGYADSGHEQDMAGSGQCVRIPVRSLAVAADAENVQSVQEMELAAEVRPIEQMPLVEQELSAEQMPPVQVRKETIKPAASKASPKLFQGTAALIIGVVFVVLAGLIFATTTWHTLPSFSKVIMIFGFSVVFFCASRIAVKIFKIEKTSQAFYILGSVFLFITVLAAGYFRLLGSGFTMELQHRFKVLCAGSLVTELALIAGIRQYQDRIYTKACFWGMSVTAFFLMKALSLGTEDSIKGMVCYSFLLIAASEIIKNKGETMPPYMNAGFSTFAEVHFWIFSGITALFAAAEWLVIVVFKLISGKGTVSFSMTFAVGVIAAGIILMTLRKKRPLLQILHSISMVVFVHFLSMCIPADFIYQSLVGALLTGTWFFLNKWKKSPLSSLAGDCFYSLIFGLETIFIMLIAFLNWNSMGEFWAALVSVIMLTAILSYWSRKYPRVRPVIPFVLAPVTIAIWGMAVQADLMYLKYEWIVFVFLFGLSVWDVVKRDKFSIAVLVMGTAAQLFFRMIGIELPLFALLLSGYLFIKSYQAEGTVKEWYEKSGCLYLLAGVFFITDCRTDIFLLQMLCVTAVFAIEYVIFNRLREGGSGKSFWEITGVVILVLDMTAFYLNPRLAWGYMVSCLVVFAVFYIMLYRNGRWWTHLVAAISVLPMALALRRYGVTDNQLYGYTAAALLASGILARRLVPIITCEDGEGKPEKYDWFHMLIIVVLVPMTTSANEEWRCAYLLLIALYALQYTVSAKLRRGALTTAAALVLLAFWLQPFIRFPERIHLEVQLAAAFLFIWQLAYVWDKKAVSKFQTSSYCVFLVLLIGDAFLTGHVVDALMLEVVCLTVFVWANIKKHVLWLRISGTVIVAVALYMTKDFWLSLSWWVYLLAAGLGLIIFAAVNEIKKQ